jgi:methionyl-tRNA formyltransferase
VPQRHEAATLAPRLKKTDGVIDWHRPAREIANLVRGCNPWPGATTAVAGGTLTVWRARAVAGAGEPRTLLTHDPPLLVATGEDALLPLEVQPASRRAVDWDEFLRGAGLAAGQRLVTP